MRKTLLIAVLGVVLALGSIAAAQQTHEVNLMIEEGAGPIPAFFFDPVGLFIQPGDTVVFNGVTPHHTVTAYHPAHGKVQRVPDGVPPFSSPIVPIGGTWSYTFTIPGVYDVWCGPHESYGMAMRIVVGEATGPGAEPSTDYSPLGTFDVAGKVLNSAALSPARIIAQGKVLWGEVVPEL